ncbi:ferredoxin reductase-like protein [Tothia fuscella]|uniref:Ferredoxin reductase-like protein n=1 Tax=Tothia fuscella TaxID=1048955 RepID=A0A9P4NM29_9PEZI|nr:ferredoxin reductase-like protein [Tothia fuscella]
MANKNTGLPHEDRTAKEPRSGELHPVIVDSIDQVNETIKLFRLRVKVVERGVNFLPGQWLDVYTPSTPKAGGFTITSTPSQASPHSPSPYLELAVQKSPYNPPAAWLWQDPSTILGQELRVRVGGSFVWPPKGVEIGGEKGIDSVVFVAGGVGINPLISMLSHIREETQSPNNPLNIHFMYTTKSPNSLKEILFLNRLIEITKALHNCKLHFFITGCGTNVSEREENQGELDFAITRKRFNKADLDSAIGKKEGTVCYVCGPPRMTDKVVEYLGGVVGRERVFCEKWW